MTCTLIIKLIKMEEYELGETLGGGSFAVVVKGRKKTTGEEVAFKILKKKYTKWEDCLELRECKSLQKLHQEELSNQKGIDNIIKLKEIIFEKESGTLNLVFEYMKQNLYEFLKENSPKRLSESQIKAIIYQTLLGLSCMHKYGFFHRDMKPENLLIKGDTVKIADFGLAREIRSVPPYTEYVSTRYYRAPECMLKSTNYNSPVDIWALGCIMAELYLHPQPIFFGNNEKEVLYRICSVLGTPSHSSWFEGIQQAKKIGLKFPNVSGAPLEHIIPQASKNAIDLMSKMLNWDPNKRATANCLLQHPFFTAYPMNMQVSFLTSGNKPLHSNSSLNQKEAGRVNINLTKTTPEYVDILNETGTFETFISKLKSETKKDASSYEVPPMEKIGAVNNQQPFIPMQNVGPFSYNNSSFSGSQIMENIPQFKQPNTILKQAPSQIDYTPNRVKTKWVDFDVEAKKKSPFEKITRSPDEKLHLERNRSEGVISRKKQDSFLPGNDLNDIAFNKEVIIPSANAPFIQPYNLKSEFPSRRSKGKMAQDSKGSGTGSGSDSNDSGKANQTDLNRPIDSELHTPSSNKQGYHPLNQAKVNEHPIDSNSLNGNGILFGMESRRGKANASSHNNNISSMIDKSESGIFWA